MNKFKDILITGATGFVGAHLIRHYTKSNFNVTALGRQKIPPKALLKTGTKYYQADIAKDNLPLKTDIIIHTAGLANDTAKWKQLYETNVIGTKNLISNVENKLFIYISSASVYPVSDKLHSENEAINPDLLNDYGKSKYLAEQLLQGYNSYVILRPRAIYGTHDRILLPRILDMKKGNRIIAPCDIYKSISMTNIHNLIEATDLCIKHHSKISNQIYNVADDTIYNLHNVIKSLFETIHNREFRIVSIPYSASNFLGNTFKLLGIKSKLNKTSLDMVCNNHILDITKIKTELGYLPKSDFDAALPQIKQWIADKDIKKYINNPQNEPWL